VGGKGAGANLGTSKRKGDLNRYATVVQCVVNSLHLTICHSHTHTPPTSHTHTHTHPGKLEWPLAIGIVHIAGRKGFLSFKLAE